jgi:2-hydroxy-3-oxopropionate reductase
VVPENIRMRTGVIGLGALGAPVAGLLLKAGHAVAVYDVRSEPVAESQMLGARACASPAEVAQHSDIVISLVSDRAQTDDIVFGGNGMFDHLQAGAILAIGSTLGPEPVRHIAQRLAARNVEVLDIPISGGILAAREGKLSLMAGGRAETLARAQPVLGVFANQITHTGEVGSGQAAKLAHQLVFGLNVMALLEGLALGAAGGVASDAMKAVLKQGLANSGVLQVWHDLGPRWKGMLEATAPDAPLPNLRKDLHLVLEYARELGVELPIVSEASRVADAGIATGHDDPAL